MPGLALEGFKIIECGDMVGASYAAKLMADMGAEVIKIEPPSGDSARQQRSLSRTHSTSGKKWVVLVSQYQ